MQMIDFSKPLFLEMPGSDRVVFTEHGRLQLTERFAKAGHDINRIETKAQALAAIKASESHVFSGLKAIVAADQEIAAIMADLYKISE